MSSQLLTKDKALIFRIVHKENMGAVMADGCLCWSATVDRGGYHEIGNLDLIAKRRTRVVPCGPGGTLSEYVPFYFTPYSPMLYNIKTGYNGFPRKPMSEIVILISSLHKLIERGISFVFSDRHAYLKTALFSTELADLDRIIWPTLRQKNFTKSDVERFEKYQAEALPHQYVPVEALRRVVCFNEDVRLEVLAMADRHSKQVKVTAQPEWYL